MILYCFVIKECLCGIVIDIILWLIYTAGFGLRFRLGFGNPNPMTILHNAEVFILHGVGFRFQSQLPIKGMGSEPESVPAACDISAFTLQCIQERGKSQAT